MNQSEPTELETKVSAVIDVMRPAIQADEGDIFLRGVDPETGVSLLSWSVRA